MSQPAAAKEVPPLFIPHRGVFGDIYAKDANRPTLAPIMFTNKAHRDSFIASHHCRNKTTHRQAMQVLRKQLKAAPERKLLTA